MRAPLSQALGNFDFPSFRSVLFDFSRCGHGSDSHIHKLDWSTAHMCLFWLPDQSDETTLMMWLLIDRRPVTSSRSKQSTTQCFASHVALFRTLQRRTARQMTKPSILAHAPASVRLWMLSLIDCKITQCICIGSSAGAKAARLLASDFSFP